MDLHKYRNIKFTDNDEINRKIEVIFLLYDKQCEEKKLGYKDRIRLLNIFISKLSTHEEYEVAKALRDRKFQKYRSFRNNRRDFLPIYFRIFKMRINKFFKKLW